MILEDLLRELPVRRKSGSVVWMLWESLQREPIERSHGSTAPGTTMIRRRLWSGMGTDQIEGVTISIIVTNNKKTLEECYY